MVKKLTHQLRSASINSLTITIKSQSNIYFATLAFLSPNLINYFKFFHKLFLQKIQLIKILKTT